MFHRSFGKQQIFFPTRIAPFEHLPEEPKTEPKEVLWNPQKLNAAQLSAHRQPLCSLSPLKRFPHERGAHSEIAQSAPCPPQARRKNEIGDVRSVPRARLFHLRADRQRATYQSTRTSIFAHFHQNKSDADIAQILADKARFAQTTTATRQCAFTIGKTLRVFHKQGAFRRENHHRDKVSLATHVHVHVLRQKRERTFVGRNTTNKTQCPCAHYVVKSDAHTFCCARRTLPNQSANETKCQRITRAPSKAMCARFGVGKAHICETTGNETQYPSRPQSERAAAWRTHHAFPKQSDAITPQPTRATQR